MSYEKQIVLITGATSGIGQYTASYLASKGYKVYGTGRNPQTSDNKNITLLKMDVKDPKSVKQAIQSIIQQENRIDFLINNAGIGICGAVEETNIENLHDVFATNLYGAISVIQEVIPIMRHQKRGTIINITSIAGYMGLPFRAGYSASKGALEILTEALRIELKPFGIKVSNIAPGDFSTNIAQRRCYTPLDEKSPYYQRYSHSLNIMNSHVNSGEHPEKMARKIHTVMLKKNPKIHYKQARFLQKISILLKCLLPDNIFEKLLMKHYQL